jgi:hypothetical protein
VGKSEGRKRIVDHILNQFSFVKDGVELSRDDSSKRVAGDLNDQESVCDQEITPSSKNARLRLASNASKSSEAGKPRQSKRSRVSANPPSKENADKEREESGKLVVYGGASRGEGNLAYVALLRERKWDYINAETEEDAEKVVDSILQAFIFHNFTPEATRKKVSKGLQEIGERVGKGNFRWCARSDTVESSAQVRNVSLHKRKPREFLDAIAPRTISREVGRAGKTFPSSKPCKRDDSAVLNTSIKYIGTKRMRGGDDAMEETNKGMTIRSHGMPKISNIVATHDKDPESDLETDLAEIGNTTAIPIQETLSVALPALASQLAQLNQKSHSILQSQQYLDAAKLFQELGDSEHARQMMNKYLGSLHESVANV